MDHAVFREPLNQVPGIRVTWEQTFEQFEGPTQMVVWVESNDFDAVEAAINDDPGVTNPEVLTEVEGRFLFRVDFTDIGRETNLLPEIVKHGGVMREAVGTNDGWRCEVRLPDRDAIEEVYQFGRGHDIEFTFHRFYQQTGWTDGDLSLTDAQRETLIEAVDSGYLAIPRECSLDDLGERLGISRTAASERFRRAVKNLIKQSLHQ